MSDVISSDSPLTKEEREVLRLVAGLIIPASDEHGIPGADDEAIFANILASASAVAEPIAEGLNVLQELARRRHDESMTNLSKDDQLTLLRDSTSTRLLHIMLRLTGKAYYEDGRVLESINLKSTPPYPGGYELEQGDWSLLDPVKAREPFYRKT